MTTNTKFLTTTALMTVLIIVGRYITIPLQPVPLTFQAFFVILAGTVFGKKIGAAASALYLTLGLIGIPVFTGGGGIGYLAKPTFGYIIGFVVGSFLAGYLKERFNVESFFGYTLTSFISLVPVYLLGTIYFYLLNVYFLNAPQELSTVIAACILTPLPNAFIHSFLIGLVSPRLVQALKKQKFA